MHLSLKQMIADFRLVTIRDGESFHFNSSQRIFCGFGVKTLIDGIEYSGVGLTFLTHNNILIIDTYPVLPAAVIM